MSYDRLRQAVDDARLKDLVSWDGIARCFGAHARRGRDGTTKMRAYLDEHLGEVEIPLSTWSRLVADVLVDAGLPEPELEWEVVGEGFRYQLDLAYPDLRLGMELDSITWHLNRRSFQDDRTRSNRLENAGWSMRYFTYEDYRRRPAALAETVREARRQRTPYAAT